MPFAPVPRCCKMTTNGLSTSGVNERGADSSNAHFGHYGEVFMRTKIAGVILLFSVLGANAGQKTYVTGTLVNIESSHDSTTYKGTSVGSYYQDYTRSEEPSCRERV